MNTSSTSTGGVAGRRFACLACVLVPPVVPLLVLVVSAIDPAAAERMIVKERGIVEHLTVAVLVPGILAGLWGSWVAFRGGLMPKWWIPGWFVMWSFACVYFAGEEVSWGQHYFGWETSEMLGELNDQNETNLHNISSWLDQKPRALVELFVVVGGLIVPLVHRLQGEGRPGPDRWDSWVWPTAACSTAAAMLLVSRAAEAAESAAPVLLRALASSETREYAIALFLAMYLVVWAVRVRARRRAGATPGSG